MARPDVGLVLCGPPSPVRDAPVRRAPRRPPPGPGRAPGAPGSDGPGRASWSCRRPTRGFGFPALEAMARGTAVVAADCASLPEVCGEGAVLSPPSASRAGPGPCWPSSTTSDCGCGSSMRGPGAGPNLHLVRAAPPGTPRFCSTRPGPPPRRPGANDVAAGGAGLSPAAGDATHRERDRALVRAGVELTLVVPTEWPGADDTFGADPSAADPFEVLEVAVAACRRREPARVRRPVGARRRRSRPATPDVVDVHEEPFSVAMHQLLGVLAPRRTVLGYTAQNLDKRFPPPFAHRERRALARLDGLYPCSRQAASVRGGQGLSRRRSRCCPLAPPPPSSWPGASRAAERPGADPARRPARGRRRAYRTRCGCRRGSPHAWGRSRLDLAGDGPEAEPAAALATTLGVELHRHGTVDADRLAHLYAQAARRAGAEPDHPDLGRAVRPDGGRGPGRRRGRGRLRQRRPGRGGGPQRRPRAPRATSRR